MSRSRRRPSPSGPAPEPAPSSPDRFWTFLAWGVVAIYAAFLLAMVFGPHRVGDVFAETDFYGAYADGARALLQGRLDPSRYGVVGPGYEVALAAAGVVVRDLFLAAELLSVLAMVAGLLLWVRILSRRADPRLAALAALFLAVNPTFFRYGYSVTNDALAFALQAGALAALLTGVGPRSALLAGALAALAFLTRYNAVALLPAGIVAALAGGTLHADRRRAALLFALGFAAPVLPWVAFSLAQGQSFSFQFHHNIAYDVFARAQGIAWDDYQKLLQPQFKSLADVIARDPWAVARREAFNLWDHLRLDAVNVLGLPAALCALAGVAIAWLDGTLRRLWPVALAALLFFLTLVPVFHSERYALPLLPAYLMLAAVPFASARLGFGRLGAAGPWLQAGLVAIPLALTAQENLRQTRRSIEQLPYEVLECAAILRAEAHPGDRVLCRKPHIAYHAGVEAVSIPFTTTLAELAAEARAKRVRWIFFSWPEAEMRPAYAYLLDTTAAVPGLAIRHATTPRPAVLYEIVAGFGADPAWMANDTLRVWHDMQAKLRINPADARARLTLGAIAFDRGRIPEARQHLESGLRLAPNDVAGLLLLGESCLILEDAVGADQAYRRAASLDPRSVEPLVGLGWVSLIRRRPEEAAERWRPLIPYVRDAHTLARMEALYHALGEPEAAAAARAALARVTGAK